MAAKLRMPGRRLALVPVLVVALVALAVSAQADDLVNELDASVDSTREVLALNAGGSSAQVPLRVVPQGGDGKPGCNIQANVTSVTFSVTSSDTSVATVSPSSVTLNNCGDTPSITVTPVGAGSANVTFAVTDNTTAGTWVANTADFSVNVSPAQATNNAPTVSSAAADANGDEGDTLATSGAFADQDGDTLTITKLSGDGTVTQGANGAWSWSLPTNDDTSGTVVVQADDGNGGTVTDTFDYSAGNVDPVLSSLAFTGSNCSPTLGFSFSDAGSADTHSGSIDWGDSSTPDSFTASPVSQSHAYSSAGTYPISVQVTDDDGGTDSDTTMSHTVKNIPSAVLQPINSTGARSAFKLGSTVPVKITVADCAGGSVATLGPQVSLVKLDSTPDGTSVETVSTASPTSGTTMRYDATAQQYVYNLATKGLSAGDFRVTISDGSFDPVSAVFSLKK